MRELILSRTAASAADTARIAAALAPPLDCGDVVALAGDLGAGKTTFARALISARAQALGVPAPEVPSPTFTLVQIYELGGCPVWHFDLYRLDRAADALELGLEEAFADGISFIEWPERLGALLPERRIDVRLGFGREAKRRMIEITAAGGAAAAIRAALAHV